MTSLPPARRLSLVELVAVLVAIAAAGGGFLAYAHAETRSIAAQAVAVHAATPGHPGTSKEQERLRSEIDQVEARLSRLEGDSRVTAEILRRIEQKIDKLAK